MKFKKFFFLAGLFIVLFIIGFSAANRFREDTIVRRTRFLLGTIVEIQVRNIDKEKAEKIISMGFKEFSRIDDLLSTYKSSSPLFRINESHDSLLQINPEIYSLIKKCSKISETTNGAFDICLDSLISVWGFGKASMSVPDDKILQKALRSSGRQNLKLADENTIIRNNSIKFNFGAVAAGYAVDKVVNLLRHSNIKDALVNGGGEISAIGNNWSIGIQHPRIPGAIIDKIRLNGYAVATSGDYEQYFEENGVRYHHLLDPAIGQSARECQSVTIITLDNTTADALATGVFVLGPEKGMALVENLENVEALIVDKNGIVSRSSGFHKFLLR